MGKSLKIKRGDNAVVISGKDKGLQGRVLRVKPREGKVIVEGANMLTKHKKPRGQQQPGGIIHQEGAFDISNVMVVCPTCAKATRVAHSIVGGDKVRICKKCGSEL